MNDNDIIKALGRCRLRDCYNCVRLNSGHKEERFCRIELLDLTLNLISRQKAKIERLYKTLSVVQREQYINGRNDGIKEFEEKLKEKAFYVQESEWDGYVVNCNDIIGFAKEMTEEQE